MHLAFTSSDATVLRIDQGVGDVLNLTSKDVAVTSPTTFTISAVNAKGSAVMSVSVGVERAPPVISSFVASQTSLPFGGGPSVLTWKTAGADSVTLSDVGAVDASSFQNVTVTSSKSYMLTATNTAGSVSASVSLTVATSTSITGRIVYEQVPQPIPLTRVQILGTSTVTTTDSDGVFTLNGVTPPYSIAFQPPGSTRAYVYYGLTRLDPWLVAIGRRPATRSAVSAAGHITYSGAPPGGGSGLVQYTSPFKQNGWSMIDGSQNFDLNGSGSPPQWAGAAYDTGELFALHLDGSNTYYGKRSGVTFAEGGSFSGLDITVALMPNITVAGSFEIPGNHVWDQLWTGSSFEGGGGYYSPRGPSGNTFNFDIAVLPQAVQFVKVRSKSALDANETSEFWAHNLTASTSSLSIFVPAAPSLSTPAQSATNVSVGSTFSWTAPVPSVNMVSVFLPAGPFTAADYMLVTTDASVTLPDVSTLVALAFGSNRAYRWYVRTLSPIGSMDEVASEGGAFYRMLDQFDIAHSDGTSVRRDLTTTP